MDSGMLFNSRAFRERLTFAHESRTKSTAFNKSSKIRIARRAIQTNLVTREL